MKRTYKNLFSFAIAGLLSLPLAFTANAQHRGGGGGGSSSGGGGGSRSGGGGGGSVGVSRSSGGGNVGVARPSFNGGGGSGQRSAIAPVSRGFSGNGNVTRGNVNVAPQRGYGNRTNSVAVAPQRSSINGGGQRVYSGTRSYNSVDRRAYNGGRGSYYNGANGYGNRVYANGYRYGGRGGYFGSHGYYPYHNYYNSYYYPRIGFSIGFLPFGYYPFWYGDYQYYYSDGLYYRQYNDQYTVVEPPIGAEVKNLPSDAKSISINGEQYYESNGVYYQPYTKDDGTQVYVIAGKDGELNTDNGGNGDVQQGPQIGDIVNQLPDDCRKIKINGEKLFVSPDGFYYQESKNNNGDTVYKIVGTPSDEPDQQ
ncbi:DUF6515 family protein [Mucilaginibacter sp.]|uniref:DUF6515 family protein n=1 Tax=Mucilaginibacter sp. TaxID=1882438 RepID=UPI0025F3D62B|nr:DUF6515 family protein [Mucilaginibacter sp.]